MARKIARVSLTLPLELLDELNRVLEAQDYSSRSEAVRDALRDFLAGYQWRQELKGELLGAVVVVFEHDIRGLTDRLADIQHEERGVIVSVQHLHVDERNCLETLVVRGPAEKIRGLVDRLGSLKGVKQVRLATVGG